MQTGITARTMVRRLNLEAEQVRQRMEQNPQVRATTHTAQVFNQGLGQLVKLKNNAARSGEVVTQSQLELTMARVGPHLVARDARTEFDAKRPQPDIGAQAEAARQQQAQREEVLASSVVPQSEAPPRSQHASGPTAQSGPAGHQIQQQRAAAADKLLQAGSAQKVAARQAVANQNAAGSATPLDMKA